MEREKLIEARSKFMRDNRSLIGNDGPLIADAFDACEEAIMSMPLADRLTEEEKERIKNLYLTDEEIDGVKSAFGAYPVAAATITKNILESIFGSDLFKEK